MKMIFFSKLFLHHSNHCSSRVNQAIRQKIQFQRKQRNRISCYSWVFKMDYFLTFYLNLMRVARHTSYYVVITFALTFPLVCQPKKILSCKRPLEKTLSSFSRHKKSGNSHLLSITQLIWFHIQIFKLYFALRKSEIIDANRSIWH